MLKRFALLAVFLLTTTATFAQQKTQITVSGSDTMNLLTQRLAEVYQQKHPEVEISVRGGGSGVGINDLVEGLVDIAQASRKMKPEEEAKIAANGFTPVEYVVGLDGLAVAVHAENPVTELSLAQIKAIYTGAVQKWSQLNPAWPDEKIVVYSRESSSGTYDFFKEHVLKGADFASGTSYLAATAAVANSVADNRSAIGFGGIAYFVRVPNAKVISVKETKDKPAVSPVAENGTHPNLARIQDGSYPIARPLQYYSTQRVSPDAKAFLDWMTSPEGQKIVEEMEYIPLAAKAEAKQ